MDLIKFKEIFIELQKIFKKYYIDSEIVNKLIESIDSDNQKECLQLLTSNEIWGGSGALWESYPMDDYELRVKNTDAERFSEEEMKKDKIKYKELVLSITEEIKNQNIEYPRAEEVAKII